MIHFYLYKSTVVLLLLSLIVSATKSWAWAQNEEKLATIEGIVTGEDDKPLHLAHVMVQGRTQGDVTNQDGRFKFDTDTSEYKRKKNIQISCLFEVVTK